MAYVLLEALRRIGLKTTRLARATAGTIRLKLLKIGALVRLSVRRVTVAMASGHPWQRDWAIAHHALAAAAPSPPGQRIVHIAQADCCRPVAPYLAAQRPAGPPPATPKSANHAHKPRCLAETGCGEKSGLGARLIERAAIVTSPATSTTTRARTRPARRPRTIRIRFILTSVRSCRRPATGGKRARPATGQPRPHPGVWQRVPSNPRRPAGRSPGRARSAYRSAAGGQQARRR